MQTPTVSPSPSPVRVRFAPSPTGYLHVGGARTALFNWLYARHVGGQFILRVEDTDKSRNTAEAAQAIYDGLRWLGLDWDEGPGVGGEYGPYFQSERDAIYERYLDRLREGGFLYEDAGAVRFRSPREVVTVDDLVCGKIFFDLTNPGTHPDMTLRRPDGSWIFHFVNVVDDIEMKVSHVIRGEDHLSNTPKHVELYRALGAAPPRFAHIPLILNRDGSKMSKRDQGASIASYVEGGYAPEAVVNYLCLLGWSPKDNREKIDLAEVVQLFELEKINRRNAAFDLDKCFWLNGQYIATMSLERFRALCVPFLERAELDYARHGEDYLGAVLGAVKEKIKILRDVPAWTAFFFTEEFPFEEDAVNKTLRNVAGATGRLQELAAHFDGVSAEGWTPETIEGTFKELAVAAGVKTALYIHPARVAVSGRSVGPSLYHMLEILGRDRIVRRLRAAAERFGSEAHAQA